MTDLIKKSYWTPGVSVFLTLCSSQEMVLRVAPLFISPWVNLNNMQITYF